MHGWMDGWMSGSAKCLAHSEYSIILAIIVIVIKATMTLQSFLFWSTTH